MLFIFIAKAQPRWREEFMIGIIFKFVAVSTIILCVISHAVFAFMIKVAAISHSK